MNEVSEKQFLEFVRDRRCVERFVSGRTVYIETGTGKTIAISEKGKFFINFARKVSNAG